MIATKTMTAALIGTASITLIAGTATAAPAAQSSATDDAPSHSVTSAKEAARVDNLNLTLDWQPCLDASTAEEFRTQAEEIYTESPEMVEQVHSYIASYEAADCATATVPVDYDEPDGDTYDVPVSRQSATDQDGKIGALFMNPGGPGGSAFNMAARSDTWVPDEIKAKFDIIGVEPRLMGRSPHRQCFDTPGEFNEAARGAVDMWYPSTNDEFSRWYQMAFDLGRACGINEPMMSASTTAEVVRDMEVVRQAIGAPDMNLLGFSYGTHVAQVYGNMYPDRARALVADGVVEANDWAGVRHPSRILDARLGSAKSAEAAFYHLLALCENAGSDLCVAAKKDSNDLTAGRKWAFVTDELKREPLKLDDSYTLTLAEARGTLLGTLYARVGAGEAAASFIDYTYGQVKNRADGDGDGDAVILDTEAAAQIIEHVENVREDLARQAGMYPPAEDYISQLLGEDTTKEGEYNTWFEGYSAVICGDGRHPLSMVNHTRQADNQRFKNPTFGQAWAWGTVQCTPSAWIASDEDSFRGPFNKQTKFPMLFVGNKFDPATPQDQAVKAAKRQPGALLITSDSWGHTAYQTSDCATDAVNAYLLDPTKGYSTHCVGDYVPFATEEEEGPSGNGQGRTLPEVAGLGAGPLLESMN